MVPLWKVTLLSINSVEEFSFTYNEEQKIFIDGKKLAGEWIIKMRVDALPYFAWGCNNYHTKVDGSHKEAIRYYLSLVLNQLTEYCASGRDKLLQVIRDNLE